jgi:hypothetical protein
LHLIALTDTHTHTHTHTHAIQTNKHNTNTHTYPQHKHTNIHTYTQNKHITHTHTNTHINTTRRYTTHTHTTHTHIHTTQTHNTYTQHTNTTHRYTTHTHTYTQHKHAHIQTHETNTHTHSVGLPWMRDRPVTEISTCTTHNIHKRETSVPPLGFESAIPASELPLTRAFPRAATGIGNVSITFDSFNPAIHRTPIKSSAEGKERVELYISLPSRPSWPFIERNFRFKFYRIYTYNLCLLTFEPSPTLPR